MKLERMTFKNLLKHYKKHILIFILIALPGLILPSKLVFSYGNSVKSVIFWKVKETPGIDRYVVVKTDSNNKYTKGRNIVKKVACMGGDYLLVTVDKDYYCIHNGQIKHIGKAKDKDKKGDDVTNFVPCEEKDKLCRYLIPYGNYFVVGEHKDSYDSKYMGFIDEKNIITVVYPVI
ncbi:MAG: S26 family signal peptidase [Candidatus Micrarchaeia archaeon]